MKILIVGMAVVFGVLVNTNTSHADQYVKGYQKRDGTYVPPHYRSSPDRSYNNNWSVQPNVNPHTGEMGSRQPTWNDRPPGYNDPFSSSGQKSLRR